MRAHSVVGLTVVVLEVHSGLDLRLRHRRTSAEVSPPLLFFFKGLKRARV